MPRLSGREKPRGRATAVSFVQFCRLDGYMKAITVNTARKRFGALLNAVQDEPVLIRRKNGDEVVIISAVGCKQIYGITSFDSEPIKLT
jgi:prevent-host-death family protein